LPGVFNPVNSQHLIIEDVFNLIEKLSKKNKKLIVVFDEFQEIVRLGKDLDKKLRAIIQHHKMVNYLMLGSQESLMREIFEQKKSPFYHFGYLMYLDRINFTDLSNFLYEKFRKLSKNFQEITEKIIQFTNQHPYYTQQLAFNTWEYITKNNKADLKIIIDDIILSHDNDYERLWGLLNKTEMKILIALAFSEKSPLTDDVRNKFHLGASSTVFSSIKKLIQKGFVIQIDQNYEIEDPFFKKWLIKKRKG
jgi:hypothetical protein